MDPEQIGAIAVTAISFLLFMSIERVERESNLFKSGNEQVQTNTRQLSADLNQRNYTGRTKNVHVECGKQRTQLKQPTRLQ
jgi:hypothetical protein